MTIDIEKLKEALEKAQDLIAANRLVLGEYSGVREVHQIESRIKEAISIVAGIENSQEETEHAMHMRIRAGYDKTIADCWRAKVSEVEKERDEARAALADAYRRGAEAMREQVASLFDGGQNMPGLMKSPEFRDFIRTLAVPEGK